MKKTTLELNTAELKLVLTMLTLSIRLWEGNVDRAERGYYTLDDVNYRRKVRLMNRLERKILSLEKKR